MRIDVLVVKRACAACLPRSDRTSPSAQQAQRSPRGWGGGYETHQACLAYGVAGPRDRVAPGARGAEPSTAADRRWDGRRGWGVAWGPDGHRVGPHRDRPIAHDRNAHGHRGPPDDPGDVDSESCPIPPRGGVRPLYAARPGAGSSPLRGARAYG